MVPLCAPCRRGRMSVAAVPERSRVRRPSRQLHLLVSHRLHRSPLRDRWLGLKGMNKTKKQSSCWHSLPSPYAAFVFGLLSHPAAFSKPQTILTYLHLRAGGDGNSVDASLKLNFIQPEPATHTRMAASAVLKLQIMFLFHVFMLETVFITKAFLN